ncbi:MAG: N-acetyltransferase [Sphingomonadaceae bacterium]|uniref:GNAT family N-acetyltransferase n=1 Tax=Thermaurantiacus sp. TaxID=2820283 RepID=UPI00298EE37A|nr:N-acetyltransferase [Thermaurantiacus sp.]MCS6986116.1 N-acetyltransferase [Sphingomonadaceae bacterium]MDW8414668.1 N-acetyltransferase [Thermaurantiacus sp.]
MTTGTLAGANDRLPADVTIEPMAPGDRPAVDALVERCFGPERRGRTANLLRGTSAPVPGLAFVAVARGALVGAIRCHPVAWQAPFARPRPLLLLGPMVTAPERRGQGIGLALLARVVAELDAQALDCALIGDAPYYGRFGWSADVTQEWELPGPVERHRLLLRARHPALYGGRAKLMAAAQAGLPAAA